MGFQRLLPAGLLVTLPGAALAHTGHAHVGSLGSGLLHPMTGLDHVLAMVAVGLLAAHLGGRAILALPLAFLSMMLIGGSLAAAGLPLPLAEFGVLASVLVLGGLIASGRSLPDVLVCCLAAVFALFHGHIHGSEVPATANALLYAAGFVSGTGLLHAAGVALGLGLGRFAPALTVRGAGIAIVIIGAGLVVA